MILDFLHLSSFWRPQELANQFAHAWFGLGMSLILWYSGCGLWSLLGGLIGMLETFRQAIWEKPEKNLDWYKDKIRDNICYFMGSFFTLIFYYFPFPVVK